jgi:hypothetical protein
METCQQAALSPHRSLLSRRIVRSGGAGGIMGDVMGETQLITWLIGQVLVGAAIWGGIRADIRGMHMRMEHAEKSTAEAHQRIDKILERGR